MAKPARQGIMAQVLGRMCASETLISDRHADSMLLGLLSEAEKVEDPTLAWNDVRTDVCGHWGWDEDVNDRKPFIYSDGVAIIPVHGILINRFSWCWGFVTGYDFIRSQRNLALADPDVKLIVYDHDTPGGEAAGCDEVAQEIFKGRAEKPSLSIVNTSSCSAGYWLAAAADKIVCAPSGSVGSIGVYIQHMNIAGMLKEWGIEIEFIKEGKYKTSGNSYERMSDADRDYLQSMVAERMNEFCAAVAEFRGIEESVARGTQARVLRPTEAIALGLIDAAVSPAEAVGNFLAELGGNDTDPTELEDEAMAEMTSEERAAILKEERERVGAILGSDEAKGRDALAKHIAFSTAMTPDEATAMLAAAPKAEDPKPAEEPADDKPADDKPADDKPADDAANKGKSQFENAMDSSDHPNITGGKGGGDGEQSRVDAILGAQALATGRKPAKV